MGIWDEIINSDDQQIDLKKDDTRNRCAEYGSICPQRGAIQLLYDGKLILICPECGYESSAGFTR